MQRAPVNILHAVDTYLAVFARLVALALLIVSLPAEAIDLSRKPSQLTERHWTKANGLPAEFIWGLYQSEAGYLWLATDAGVARFDGLKFETFSTATHDAFLSNDIREVTGGPVGTIWAASVGGGLLRIRGREVTRFDRETGLVSDAVYSVLVAKNGDTWVGTASGGCVLRETATQCWSEDDGMTPGRIVRLAEDQHGHIWFASATSGVSVFDGEQMRMFGAADGMRAGGVTVIVADPELNMLVATLDGAYYRADIDGLQRIDNVGIPADAKPFNGLRDRDGNILISMLGSIWQFRPDARRLDSTAGDIGYVTDLLEDADGQVWASASTGLYQFRAGLFTPLGAPEGVSDQTFVVANGGDGSVWTGTEAAGLFHVYPDGRARQLTTADGLPHNGVSSVMVDPDGAVWAGTYGGGLVVIRDNEIVRAINSEHGLIGAQVGAIFRDRDGTVWVGTNAGLNRLSDDGVTATLTVEDGLLADLVRDIRQDAEGRLLLSGDNGLTIVSPDSLEVIGGIDGSQGLSNYAISTTYVDASGVIWIGGRSSGLLRLDGDALFQFNASHNVTLTSVMTIVEDDQGFFWLGGRDGIARIPRAELDAVALGKRDRVSASSYSVNDGLRATRVSGGYQAAATRNDDGTLWFATTKGLVFVDPKNVSDTASPAAIDIEAVRADGAAISMSADSSYRIPAGTQTVQIDYTVPSINASDSLRFHYRIGNNRWQSAEDRRTAFFTTLPPRNNKFEVAVRYAGQPYLGDRGQKIAIDLFVEPLWYQTRIAIVLTIIATMLLIWGGYHFSLRYYRLRHRHLEALVDQRTAALQNALSEVRAMSRIDILTGVANRRSFEERMREEWSRAIRKHLPVTMMMIDIDHFKQFNDSAGHQEGDHCLTAVAQALKNSVRDEDFVARYGGEEFAVLLSGTDVEQMCRIGKRLQEGVRALDLHHPGLPDGGTVTVSAGFASAHPDDGDDAEELIRRADAALYRAKEQGRDRVVVDQLDGTDSLTITGAIRLEAG
ncbi:MAG: diguanylate cyclase [Pseudomonadota bacterium]